MSKLIDAEKLDFVSYQGIPNGYKDSFDSGVLYAMNLIDEQPTIDAVPVVRCRDCKWCSHFTDGHIECRLLYDLKPVPRTYMQMREDDYCSYGEKVTEDG